MAAAVRNRTDPRHADRRMRRVSGSTPRRGARTLAAGACAAGVYLAGAAISGHLSPAARRPVLDGFGSAQAYRWVKPPPALALNNQPPHHARQTFVFKGGVLQGGVVSTNDLQATVIFQDGSIKRSTGATGVLATVDPLDPATLGRPTGDLSFDGNAYRILGAYQPGGANVSAVSPAADLALTYPADATFGLGSLKHVILASADGKSWQELPSQDLPGSLQVTAKMDTFGYFVVGRTGGAAAATGGWSLSRVLPIVAAAFVVLLILLFTSPRVIRRLRRSPRDPDDQAAGA
jgi:hypothetical protein